MTYSKNQSTLLVAIIYAGSLATTYYFMELLNYSLLVNSLLGDIFCTCLIFIFSRRYHNSSIYDPYWSVIPIFLLAYWIVSIGTINDPVLLLFAGVLFWGIRLTVNWLYGWDGLKEEDWRYKKLAEDLGNWYWPVSFLGIHLFPTLLVFLGCIPAYFLILTLEPSSWVSYLGFLIMLAATIIEWVADRQMHQHKKQHTGTPIDSGLWAYSRHPNYFGEISLWVGLFLIAYDGGAPLWTVSGPVAMWALFYFISIPMMEKKLVAREGYAAYRARVSKLLFFPRKR